MALGKLSIVLDANIAKFESDTGRAARIAEQQSRAMQRSFENAAKRIGAVLGGAFALRAIEQFVKTGIDGMLQLNIAAKQVGMPVEQFSALSAVAKRADLDVQSFTAAMMKADKALTEAQSGKGASAAAFKALGIDPKQVKDNNDLIMKSADALSKYKDGIGKTAVEMAIFGRSGAQLNAFLDQGSDAIKAQAEHMKELGVALGPEAEAQLKAYDDAQKEFSDTLLGLKNRIVLALLPSLQSATEFMGGMVKSMDKEGVSGFTEVVNTLARAAIVLGGAFVTAGHAIGATLAAAGRAGHALFFETDIRHPIDSFKALGSAFTDTKNIFKEFGADTGEQWKKLAVQITDFGSKAATATAKATGADSGRKTLTFNPNADADNAAAAAKLKALASAYDALAVAAQKANEKQLSPKDKALADYTEGVRALAKLTGDYVAKGGDAARATELFLKGKAGLADAYAMSLGRINAEMQAYADNLKHEIDLQRNAIDIQVASVGMGQKEAAQLQKINDIRIRGAEAVQRLQQDLAQHPEQADAIGKQIELQKQQTEDLVKVTVAGYAKMDAARANGANGVKAAIADFMDDMQNNAERMKRFTADMINGFGNAFVQFATGAESAKKAFGSWIDSMFAQALKFLANKAIQELFNSVGNMGGGSGAGAAGSGGGFWGGVASLFGGMFGGGKAGGGYVGPYSAHQVNELGPELLSVGGKSYLMMGPQGGNITPNSALRGAGGTTQVINVSVQPTSTRRTAEQTATETARRLRMATARA